MATVYIRLSELLKERGMSQKELSELTKLRPAVISELCNNLRSSINKEYLEAIIESLKIEDISELIEIKK